MFAVWRIFDGFVGMLSVFFGFMERIYQETAIARRFAENSGK
jgi:hypothetical protein